MMTVEQAYQLALQHHQSGRLVEAEALYRQILAVQPNHADATHFLGVIAHQVGRSDLAAELIQRAVALNPHEPAAYINLGEVYRVLGRTDEAIACYRRALEMRPNEPAALNNLGNALRERGLWDEAMLQFEHALQIAPSYAEAHNNLGVALAERGRLEEAIARHRRAIELAPGYADAHSNLGNALKEKGDLDEAVAQYRYVIASSPDHAEARNNLAAVLVDLGRIDEAIEHLQRAIELKSNYADAQVNLGNALVHRGDLGGAIAAYRRAWELNPKDAATLCKLGSLLVGQGELEEAVAACRQALAVAPEYADAHNNLGAALKGLGELDQAVAAFRAALEHDSGHVEAYNNLGNVLCDQGRSEEAFVAYRHALQLRPGDAAIHSNLIFSLQLRSGNEQGAIMEETKQWNRRFAESVRSLIRPHENDRDPDRRLRIGYVSPDFRNHVVGRNLMPLFWHRDGENFEIVCYSGTAMPDEMTAEFRRLSGQWRETAGVSDEGLAEMIRHDGVDILVDLSQHTSGNRLPVFARKPAPVQVSFAGYPAGTGLEAIEYRLSDPWLAGRGMEKAEGRMTKDEQAGGEVCLLDSFWCYDPCGAQVDVNELPAKSNGHITFGSLNSFFKINESVLKLWARMMVGVEGSRLILLSREGSHRQRTLDCLAGEGIVSERVHFIEPCERMKYLQSYHLLDIALDPFPYGGHTTSLDALWMGVPVVGMIGPTSVSRGAFSIMNNLGLPELVGSGEEDYADIAVRLAGNLPRLAELRCSLRSRMKGSVLMDASRFARGIETAYREMWQRWCGV